MDRIRFFFLVGVEGVRVFLLNLLSEVGAGVGLCWFKNWVCSLKVF